MAQQELTPEQVIRKLRKIVREYNTKTGFSFTLSTDKKELISSKYALPVYEDIALGYTLKGQIDADTDYIYGLQLKLSELDNAIYLGYEIKDDITKEKFEQVLQTGSFRQRTEALRLLHRLSKEVDEQISTVQNNLFGEALSDMERDITYDTITTTARKLYQK